LVWLARDASYWTDRTSRTLARLREETDQALAKACAESVAQIDARFVDAKTGILPLLR
jgi:hypothetical protein